MAAAVQEDHMEEEAEEALPVEEAEAVVEEVVAAVEVAQEVAEDVVAVPEVAEAALALVPKFASSPTRDLRVSISFVEKMMLLPHKTPLQENQYTTRRE